MENLSSWFIQLKQLIIINILINSEVNKQLHSYKQYFCDSPGNLLYHFFR
jgi:hypothetical protein